MDWTGIERNEKGDKQIKLSKITNYDIEIKQIGGKEEKGMDWHRKE